MVNQIARARNSGVHPARKRHHGMRKHLGYLVSADSGLSAVEFALLAPVLLFSLLATADIGLALSERMTIDHILRAGAQIAMADPGIPAVEDALESTAAATPSVSDDLDVSTPIRYYACPENLGFAELDTSIVSGSTCAGGGHTYIFYHLAATKTYDGLFLPINIGGLTLLEFELSSAIEVQVR